MKTTLKTIGVCALVIGSFCFGRAMSEFPELNAAKKSLLDAKNRLNNANRNFGGYRAKSAEYIDKAIEQIDKAITYGDTHKD